MQRTTFGDMACSIARTLDVIGEPWSPLILRDVWVGISRFEHLQADLGISRKVLTERLNHLVERGIIDRRPYDRRPRYEYVLTDKGLDLWPTIVAMLQWGDKYAALDGPPVILEHHGCGGAVDEHRICAACGARLTAREVRALAGPGASAKHPLVQRGAVMAA